MIHFKQFKQDCSLADISFNTLAEKYGTPFYVYEAESIRYQYTQLNSALSHQCAIFYSLKANPNAAVCEILRESGAGAEVCSLAELEIALRANFAKENIIYVGPAKTTVELEACIQHDIYAIVVESIEEIIQINSIAKRYQKNVRILVRINPNFAIKSALLKMGGKASQFGIDYNELCARDHEIHSLSHTNIIGIHIYNGTRILDAEAFLENTTRIWMLAKELMQKWNRTFECIDIGGGFGIPYFEHEQEFSLAALKNCFVQLKESLLGKYPNIRIIVESGRYLVADSGMFVSKVITKKMSKGAEFLITDGGTNCHMAAVGINSPLKRNFPMLLLRDGYCTHEYQIAGPLCTPGDLIGQNVLLPVVEVGDLIGVLKSGAYGPTASPTLFLSHGFPAEILVDQGKDYLVRKRDTVKDILKNNHQLYTEESQHVAKSFA